MRFFESLAIGVAMYSKIPMPRVEWNEKNMKYAMCFFPSGRSGDRNSGGHPRKCSSCVYVMRNVCFFAGVMTLLPVLVNGGIHMDGFLDTMDALNSYGAEKRSWKF